MPGVYFFEDENKNPLYIGKSINIKSRIKQHFEGFKDKSTKATHFIPQTKTLFFKIVDNDIQAIITEANYIKTYVPRYNSAIKDDKSNTYIVFSNLPNTKILLAHATDIDSLNLDNYQKQVFGPYTSASISRILLKLSRKTFGFCLNPFNAQNKSCFNYHLKQCPGACNGQMTSSQYQSHLGHIKKFLSGKFILLQKHLNTQIKKKIKLQKFEEAEFIKRQIESLNYVLSSRSPSLLLKLSDATLAIQNTIITTIGHPKLNHTPRRIECYDLAHLQGHDYVGAMTVMTDGFLDKSQYRHFNIQFPDFSDPHGMRQILERRLKHTEWPYPDLIILDGGIPQLNTVLPVIPSQIAVIALAKKRETLIFYDAKNELTKLNLPIENPTLNVFRSLRDEAHRFGNSFHRLKKSKSLLV